MRNKSSHNMKRICLCY